jgi:hypothetical protein
LNLPALPDDGAWSLFAGRASSDSANLFTADWRIRSDMFLRSTTLSDDAFDAHWGSTPDNPSELSCGTIVLRALGRKRTFATVLDLHHGCPQVQDMELTENALSIQLWNGDQRRYDRTI